MVAVIDRFLSKVMPVPFSGCWLWMGADFSYGYGAFSFHNQNRPAHRVSWLLHKGEIPEGLFVLHKCDVAVCVNPEHLFLGTQQDNMTDKVEKRRQARGEGHGMSKLSDAQTAEILALKGSLKAKAVASRYGVTPERIWQLWG